MVREHDGGEKNNKKEEGKGAREDARGMPVVTLQP